MGSFGGHILPGTCFLIFATWLPFQLMLSTFHRHKHEHAYKRTDSVIIMCLVSSGIFVELFWPWNNNHPPYGHLYRPGTNEFWMPMNWQHFTMYLFFGFFGLARYVQTLQGSLFKGIDRLAGALAFGVEGYLFYNHVHGRSPLDTKIHLLITLICMGTALIFALSFFLEHRRKTFIMDMIIAALVFAQGTWFLHVAFILYGPNPWITPADKMHIEQHDEGHEDHHDDEMDDHHMDGMNMVEEHMGAEHMDTMFAVLFFAWHVAFGLLVISLLSFTIHKFLKKRGLVASPFDEDDDQNGNQRQRHFNKNHNQSRGAYASLEVDETPLLADDGGYRGEKDDENVLFSKA